MSKSEQAPTIFGKKMKSLGCGKWLLDVTGFHCEVLEHYDHGHYGFHSGWWGPYRKSAATAARDIERRLLKIRDGLSRAAEGAAK